MPVVHKAQVAADTIRVDMYIQACGQRGGRRNPANSEDILLNETRNRLLRCTVAQHAEWDASGGLPLRGSYPRTSAWRGLRCCSGAREAMCREWPNVSVVLSAMRQVRLDVGLAGFRGVQGARGCGGGWRDAVRVLGVVSALLVPVRGCIGCTFGVA